MVKESFKSDRENKQFIYIGNADTARLDPFGAPDPSLFPFETAGSKILRTGNKAESPDSGAFDELSIAGIRSAALPAHRQLIMIGKLNF